MVDVKLPDGKVIQVVKELYQSPECLFDPKLGQILAVKQQYEPIHKAVHKAIERVDLKVRKQVYETIILAGGSTMFLGLDERLETEVSNLVSSTTKVKVIAQKERMDSTWIGGSVLTSLSSFQNMWITQAEYKEAGGNIVNKKCF